MHIFINIGQAQMGGPKGGPSKFGGPGPPWPPLEPPLGLCPYQASIIHLTARLAVRLHEKQWLPLGMYWIANLLDIGYWVVTDNSSRIPDSIRILNTGYRIVGGEKRTKFGWELAHLSRCLEIPVLYFMW